MCSQAELCDFYSSSSAGETRDPFSGVIIDISNALIPNVNASMCFVRMALVKMLLLLDDPSVL